MTKDLISSKQNDTLAARLRNYGSLYAHPVCHEAADEIERLQCELFKANWGGEEELYAQWQAKDAEIARLRAALNNACETIAVHGEMPPKGWLDALSKPVEPTERALKPGTWECAHCGQVHDGSKCHPNSTVQQGGAGRPLKPSELNLVPGSSMLTCIHGTLGSGRPCPTCYPDPT